MLHQNILNPEPHSTSMTKQEKPRPLTLKEIDASLAQAKARVARVQDRYAAILARILKIEGQPTLSRGPVGMDAILDAVLDGRPAEVKPHAPSELATLLAEKEVVDNAIVRGNQRVGDLLLQRAAFVFAQHASEIAALDKRRVLLATELQAVNRMREVLRERLQSLGCGGMLFPTDRNADDLLGTGFIDDAVAWAQQRAIADGILTRGEIVRAAHE
jgi:hypothetical protein